MPANACIKDPERDKPMGASGDWRINHLSGRKGLVRGSARKPVFGLVAASSFGSARRQAAVTASGLDRAGMHGDLGRGERSEGRTPQVLPA